MPSIKNKARVGRYTFAALVLLLILVVAIANLPKGDQSTNTSANAPGMGSYGPNIGIAAGLPPDQAAILAEQAAQSPVTTLPEAERYATTSSMTSHLRCATSSP